MKKPTEAPLGALQRPEYSSGKYLGSQDLGTEQRYRLQRSRRHNRHLHGWGVVCGLWVVPAGDATRPWQVQVCPGFALGPHGDEIEVSTPAPVSIHDYLWRRPLNVRAMNIAYVGIRYAERQMRPVPAKPLGCSCEETIYQPARIKDGFQIDILWTLPAAIAEQIFDICESGIAPCSECPDSPYVLLARIRLPVHESDPIGYCHIEHWGR